MKIFSGSSNPDLAQNIAASVGVKLGDATVTSFPDGETFVKINENVRGRDVFIIQSTCPPTNHHLMELFIMIDAARRASAQRITAVIPFYGYARQDRKDQPRVPITAKLVANLLVEAGANRVITMDLHAQQIQGFFDIPVDHLYASPVFYRHLQSKKIKDLVVVSPDVGGMKMAYAYSKLLHSDLAIISKNRKSATETEALNIVGNVKGRTVIMVDDITETAGTLCNGAKFLKKAGAKRILAVVSHSVLSKLSVDRLKASPIEELITTDSVPTKVDTKGVKLTILSVADLLGEAIQRIHRNESVTSLFEIEK
ncbi:MAG: ribose-phosphate pyrophosphokinase [Verrucomicrobiae bacterium]|nr:ribose-phosphate pyrophosphokinase [Verrucomicrobiae bacterium]